ncbi:MAG: AAA family ATPase [Methyloligellaceae bacterium]
MSINDIERGLIARYVSRVLERGDMPVRSTRYVLYWLNDRADLLNLPLPKALTKSIGNIYSGGASLNDFSKAYQTHRDEVIHELREAADQTGRPEPIAGNLELLVKSLGLPDIAWKIVNLIACYTRFEQVQYFCDSVAEAAGPINRAIAVLVGENARVVDRLISPTGELIASGLLQYREGNQEISGPGGRYSIPARLDNSLDQDFTGFSDLRHNLLGDTITPGIVPGDYDHISTDRDMITSVLKGAVAEKAKGVNILLYGPPGSGKTELTKVAAKASGLSLYASGEDSSIDGESDRSARLSDLVFALRLMNGAEKTAILFDEMEDIAWQLMRRGGSKLYINRLLENNPVPVLWTSNNISEIDPAILRRMTLAIELKKPPARQRERILRRLSKRVGVKLTKREVERLSKKIDATPAVLENALKAAKYAGGGEKQIERAASGIIRAVSGGTPKAVAEIPDFDPLLSRANRNLLELADRLTDAESMGFSLCFSGPSGTGKSAYARYIAERLGIDTLHKRASDLLGPYVGQSEQQIASSFEEARDTNALLIFDEADSFLYDRTQAHRSWEVTQVNEMLTWMEEHPLPVCFTTNLMDKMDSASLRRFTFHMQFDYLDAEALQRAYKVFFGWNTAPQHGLLFENLTPGDFAQAKKQSEFLGLLRNKSGVVNLLSEISQAKPGSQSPIGFRA